MNIFAIDPGTYCGWATYCNGEYECGRWDLSLRSNESDVGRLIRFRECMTKARRRYGIDMIVYEDARAVRFGNATRVMAEMGAVLKLFAYEHNLMLFPVSPSQIKKHATGRGNAKKDELLDAAINKWGRIFSSYDACDARWLLDLAETDFKNDINSTVGA